jgi:hypothetical protein
MILLGIFFWALIAEHPIIAILIIFHMILDYD